MNTCTFILPFNLNNFELSIEQLDILFLLTSYLNVFNTTETEYQAVNSHAKALKYT